MAWIFSSILILIIGLITLYSVYYGITPTPTSSKVRNHIIRILPELTNQKIIELGSGWGTLAFALARHFPTCHVYAYEISPIPYLISQIIAKTIGIKNLTIKRQDFFLVSFKNISLAVCYLYPRAMERLKVKFKNELMPNSYIISHTFAIPKWVPIRMERVGDLYHTPLYLYQMADSV
jgi:predicted RNA methylase